MNGLQNTRVTAEASMEKPSIILGMMQTLSISLQALWEIALKHKLSLNFLTGDSLYPNNNTKKILWEIIPLYKKIFLIIMFQVFHKAICSAGCSLETRL